MYTGPFHCCDGDVASFLGAPVEKAHSTLHINKQKADSDLFQYENNKIFVY
jgi:hypothetical protein